MAKRQVEVFTAGCPVCEPAVKEVQELACTSCEVTIYDLSKEDDQVKTRDKLQDYGIKRLPTVVVDGKIVSCCTQQGVDREALQQAGIGVAG